MTRAVLFDLDGTLLPIEFEAFFASYFARVCRFYQAALGLDLAAPLKASVGSMMGNDGTRRNAEVFWSALESRLGVSWTVLDGWYSKFLEREGAEMGEGIVPDPAADQVVKTWRARGAKVVLATNPVFPRRLLDLRLQWGALRPESFDVITCFDTMSFCKPRPEYYGQIAQQLEIPAADCLMVGNDVGMDLLPAAKAGMRTCLVTGPHVVQVDVDFRPDHICALSEVGSLP